MQEMMNHVISPPVSRHDADPVSFVNMPFVIRLCVFLLGCVFVPGCIAFVCMFPKDQVVKMAVSTLVFAQYFNLRNSYCCTLSSIDRWSLMALGYTWWGFESAAKIREISHLQETTEDCKQTVLTANAAAELSLFMSRQV